MSITVKTYEDVIKIKDLVYNDRNVKAISHNSTFGAQVQFNVPEGANAVIVCVHTITGLKPQRLILPHQLYEKDLEKLIEENPNAKGIVIVPVRAEEYMTIAEEPKFRPKSKG